MPRSAIEIQDSIAQAIVDAIPSPWERIVVNFEYSHDEDGPDSNYCFLYITRSPAGELVEDSDPNLPIEVVEAFFELNDALFATASNRWGICDLVINNDGNYTFNFDYGPPKRLNGILDESSLGRFNTYLETYKAELAVKTEAPPPPFPEGEGQGEGGQRSA